MKLFLMMTAAGLSIFLVFLFLTYKTVTRDKEFGGDPLLEQKDLLLSSSHFQDGKFQNSIPPRSYSIWTNIKDRFGGQDRTPPGPFPIIRPQYQDPTPLGLRAVWFGHASVLVEIDGKRVFFDPMLSQFAFPVKWVAPERMNPPPLSLDELPKIDAVVITHDHYDHLDMKTVQFLSQKGAEFFVGLGVGSHLIKWGIPRDQVHEMDWGDQIEKNGLQFHCTEARHYSGRKSMSKDTLWTSWVIKGPNHQVFHSGDSGYSHHFKAIGEKFPNIDLTLIKVGDYGLDLGWQDIHMVPEHSVQAHRDLGAKVMLPIHWGVFQLSNHDWDEPIERTLAAANENQVTLVTPKLGEAFVFGVPFSNEPWWRSLSKK